MKVYIAPYKYYFGPYQLAEKILFWKDPDSDAVEKLGDALDKKPIVTVLKFLTERDRKIKVRIDPYDTWGMDHTLAHLILPMLKQLKATKHGSPYVDQTDLPEELRLTKREKKVHDEGYWNKKLKATEEEIDAASKKFHSQWDWIMEQMIWSFEQELDDDEGHNTYYDPYSPDEEIPDEDTIMGDVIGDDGEIIEEAKPLFTKEEARKRGKFNIEKYKAYQAKKQFGFTMFGKYYQSLWD